MRRWRRYYGAGPVHLAGMLACFTISAYAVSRVLGEGGWLSVFQWFVACLVLHDVIVWPGYTLADRALVRAQRRARRPHLPPGPEKPGRTRPPAPASAVARAPWANYVRFPAVISAVLLGMFFPLISRLSRAAYLGTTGFSEDAYLTNWLAVTGALFAASALAYLVHLAQARRRSRGRDDPAP